MNSLSPTANWPEALATVTECHYDFGAPQALAFGVPKTKHFRIRYNYWAPNAEGEDVLHTGEYNSPKAVPQGHLFKLRYNPDAAHENSHASTTIPRNPLIVFGLIGSIILSTVCFLILRGCR